METIPREYIGKGQGYVLAGVLCGEEGRYFRELLAELAKRIESMPKTYEQDGKGMAAMAYLHYFTASGDWYITEKDAAPDGQHQAFGYADLGAGEGELGYISIVELIANGVELDLHFTPTPLSQLVAVAG